jgi:lysophospholipase L1-like esterase
MKEQFKNKTLCLLGDSILEHGFYTYNIRSYFQGKSDKCYVFNRGVAGNRAVMAEHILDDEIFWLNPDYVFICFGANDLGIWLYDSLKDITPELLERRKARDDEYVAAYENLINLFLNKGIKPVVMSPYAVNSFIKENNDVETVTDNDEKEDNIKPSFYKRKTFENINDAFKGYAKRLKELAEKYDVLYLDMFEKTYEEMKKIEGKGLFFDDGIHYTKEEGHALLADVILEFLGCEKARPYKKTTENDRVFELEQLERSTGYLRRCTPMNPYFGKRTEEEILEYAKTKVDGDFEWGKLAARNYIAHHAEIEKMKEQLRKLVFEL